MVSQKVDEAFLKRVAQNARIELTPSELKKLVPQFAEILAAFEKIDEVDITDTAPAFHPVVLKSRLRDDTPVACLSTKDALSNAAHIKPPYFRGPRAMK